MPRYRRVDREEQTEKRAREQEERLRQEMRELTLREVRTALNMAIKDMEREFNQSLRGLQSISGGTSRNGSASDDEELFGLSPNRIGTWAGFLMGAISRINSGPKNRTYTSQSTASETVRSDRENQFYRESRSQREFAISQLSGGTRSQ